MFLCGVTYSKEFLERQKDPPKSPGRPKIGSELIQVKVSVRLKTRLKTALRLSEETYVRVPRYLRSQAAFVRHALEKELVELEGRLGVKEGSDEQTGE